jgi:hypothetical protein
MHDDEINEQLFLKTLFFFCIEFHLIHCINGGFIYTKQYIQHYTTHYEFIFR